MRIGTESNKWLVEISLRETHSLVVGQQMDNYEKRERHEIGVWNTLKGRFQAMDAAIASRSLGKDQTEQ